MKWISVAAMTVALTFGAATVADAAVKTKADKAQKKAAKKANKKPVKGTILSVMQDKDKESGTIKVNVAPKAKKGEPAPKPEEKTFKVTTTTKLESVTGKKADKKTSTAKFSDLMEGKAVTLSVKDDTAQSIEIAAAKKKKKNK